MAEQRPESSVVQQIASATLGENITVEPVTEGVSTYVYRLLRGSGVLYLRILPEVGASFAPEVMVHMLLHRQGVRVPNVVYWEDRNTLVERSVMITTAIAGTQIDRADPGTNARNILRAAGRDLAVLNHVPVDGFGWIKRDAPGDTQLRADLPTERDMMLAGFESALRILGKTALAATDCDRLRDVVHGHIALLDATRAYLAHGDFDVTHIFCDARRYTGIIDLGEIKGAGPYYDLGHFRFHDGEALPGTVLPYLLEGYQELVPLPSDADRRIALASLLIGVDFLARTYVRLGEHNREHALAAIGRDINLLTA